jgi:nitrogen fixation protein
MIGIFVVGNCGLSCLVVSVRGEAWIHNGWCVTVRECLDRVQLPTTVGELQKCRPG